MSRRDEIIERMNAERRAYALQHIEKAIEKCGAMAVGRFAVLMVNRHREIYSDLTCYLDYGRIAQILLGSSMEIGYREETYLFERIFVHVGEIQIPNRHGSGMTSFYTSIYNPTKWGNSLFHALSHEWGARPISVAEPELMDKPPHPDWLDWTKYGVSGPPRGWREGIERGYQIGDRVDWDALNADHFYEKHTGTIHEMHETHFIAIENGQPVTITEVAPHLPEAVGKTIESS